jgi:hypothetical protein
MFTLETKTQKDILIKKIEDEIIDILTQFGRMRRMAVHYILARSGFISNPGEGSHWGPKDPMSFQGIINNMEKKGLIVMARSKARGTFIDLV